MSETNDATITGVSEDLLQKAREAAIADGTIEAVEKEPENDQPQDDAQARPAVLPREEIFAQIEARRLQELEQEGVIVETAAPSVDKPVDAPAAGIEVKIDGETKLVTEDQINDRLGVEGEITQEKIRDYQKHLTADKRMEDVAAERKANDEARRANEARAAELAKQEAALAVLRATPAGEAAGVLDADLVGKLGDAFLVEDHQEASRLLLEIVRKAAPAPTSNQDISPETVEKAALNAVAALEYERELKAGQKEVREKYGHLVGDASLEAAVNAKAKEIFDADSTKSPREILISAAKAVNEAILKASGTKQMNETDERLERKRAASVHAAPAKTAGGVSPGPAREAAPQSTKQVVASIVAERNAALTGRAG